ncbi:MAG: GNAT family protein [Ignavibacteriaceae bacterium]
MFSIKLDNDTELRELELSSANDLFNLICSNRNYLRKWLTWVDNIERLEDIENQIKSDLGRDMVYGRFVLEIRHLGNLAGLINFHNQDKNNKIIELGYWFAENFQGKGIMTKSCIACINYAFLNLEFNRVVVKCAVGNERSKGIPERLHFTFEGIEKEGQNLYGEYMDMRIYSMLKRDWIKPDHVNLLRQLSSR